MQWHKIFFEGTCASHGNLCNNAKYLKYFGG